MELIIKKGIQNTELLLPLFIIILTYGDSKKGNCNLDEYWKLLQNISKQTNIELILPFFPVKLMNGDSNNGNCNFTECWKMLQNNINLMNNCERHKPFS